LGERLGNAEVDDLGHRLTVLHAHQDVGRLDVAVEQRFLIHGRPSGKADSHLYSMRRKGVAGVADSFIFRFQRSAAPPSVSRLARLTTLYRLAEATLLYPLVDGQQQQRLGNHASKIVRFSFLTQRHDVA
jgi:hypothetical protein